MYEILRFLFLMSLVLLQACQHKATIEQLPTSNKQINLTKAADYNLQMGLGYLKQGDRPRAKKKLLTALTQAPNSADANAAMAYFFEQTADMDNAKKHYLKAISLSNTAKSAVGAQYNNYGTFLCRQGDYKKAEIYFLKAVKDVQYVNTAGAYENAGLCSLAMPDENKAKFYFTQALEQDPSRNESLFELVKLLSKEGHDPEALKLLQKNPELVLNDRVFLSFAKEIANKTGDVKLAEEYGNTLAMINSGANNEYNNSIG